MSRNHDAPAPVEYAIQSRRRIREEDSEEDALQLGPRKKACQSDPLIHRGRHFGRTEHALCNVRTLLMNGLASLRMAQAPEDGNNANTARARRSGKEQRVFQALLQVIPSLERRLLTSSDEEVLFVADLIQKGISGARSDDTKSLKSAIIDWITPPGQSLTPPLARNVKTSRGFNHDCTGSLLCPAGLDWSDIEVRESLRDGQLHVTGDQWPIFLYKDYSYDPDDPWKGLLRSDIIISAYKHIFTSPSSVGKEARATRSGNARIHNMTRVTRASIAYVATQARFSLSSCPVFSRSDTVTDSERFYTSILELLDDPEEADEVNDLLGWWDRQIFPSFAPTKLAPMQNSVLAKIRAKRAVVRASQEADATGAAPALLPQSIL